MPNFYTNNGGLIGTSSVYTSDPASASGAWRVSRHQQLNEASIWPDFGPPVGSYLAWYDANSLSGSSWLDKSGNGFHATISGTATIATSTGNGASKTFRVVQGSTATVVTWPSRILPQYYSLFHVSRYNGTEQRIFNGTNNWLSGFWNGNAGVAYHEGWITAQTDLHTTNWVYSTDQNSLYRSNGTSRGTSGGSASTDLRINTGQYEEDSDWQVAEVIIFVGNISSNNYLAIESYFSKKYGI